MPTYIIKRITRRVRPESDKLIYYEYNYIDRWEVDAAWPDEFSINTEMHPDPWFWKKEEDERCAAARNEYIEGWSVYIDMEELDTIRALELGMAKINEAMGLLPEKQIQNKVRKIVRHK